MLYHTHSKTMASPDSYLNTNLTLILNQLSITTLEIFMDITLTLKLLLVTLLNLSLFNPDLELHTGAGIWYSG